MLLTHDHHGDNLDEAGRSLLPSAGTVVTTVSGVRRLGGDARGLAAWASTTLEGPGRPSIEVTATPCRHGPPLSRPIVGEVVGFALRWEGQRHGALWISGDTVLYGGVRQVAGRVPVGLALVHLGGVRFPVTGPLRYTMTARDAVTLLGEVRPHTAEPVHYEGWKHFQQPRSDLSGPIVLVGHSYGGIVITNAATGNPNVKALVYIAAFAPDEGEPIVVLQTKFPGSRLGQEALDIRQYGPRSYDGYIKADVFREIFAADLPASTTAVMAATQRPGDLATLEQPSGPPAWKAIPSWYLVAKQDQVIPAAAQHLHPDEPPERAGQVHTGLPVRPRVVPARHGPDPPSSARRSPTVSGTAAAGSTRSCPSSSTASPSAASPGPRASERSGCGWTTHRSLCACNGATELHATGPKHGRPARPHRLLVWSVHIALR